MENKPAPKLTALTLAEVARALSAASGRSISEDVLRADVRDGAPQNTDGTINLFHYAAWLAHVLGHEP